MLQAITPRNWRFRLSATPSVAFHLRESRLDENGNVVEEYTYDAYGNVSGERLIGNPYYFTGRRLDDETGIYYYRARMYDPLLGRFLQRDPIGYYDSMNLYSYVRNNPTNWVDPYGEFIPEHEDDVPTIEDIPDGPNTKFCPIGPRPKSNGSSNTKPKTLPKPQNPSGEKSKEQKRKENCKRNPLREDCKCEDGNPFDCQTPDGQKPEGPDQFPPLQSPVPIITPNMLPPVGGIPPLSEYFNRERANS